MRASAQLYRQPIARNNFSLVQIQMLVEAGIVNTKSVGDRRRMRDILKANIEAQKQYGINALHVKAKEAHFELAAKLEKLRKKILDR